jgi:hypothetical protein
VESEVKRTAPNMDEIITKAKSDGKPKHFHVQFNIDLRTNCEAVKILSKEKTIKFSDVKAGEVTTHGNGKLVLAPGAVAQKTREVSRNVL